MEKLSQKFSPELLKRLETVFAYLKNIAYGTYEISKIMKLCGINEEAINCHTMKTFIDEMEIDAPGEYTRLKFEQGKAYVASNLLKCIYDMSYYDHPLDNHRLEMEMKDMLYLAYWDDLVEEFSKKHIPDDAANTVFKRFPMLLINRTLEDTRRILSPSRELLNDEKYRTFILQFAEKYFFEELEQSNPNFQDASIENCEKMLENIKDSILSLHVHMPGEKEYSFQKKDEQESIVSFFNSGVSVKHVIGILKCFQEAGIELTDKQERIIKYFNRRTKMVNNIEEAKERNIKLSEERLEWQNDPTHPDNVRKEELQKAKNILEGLEKLEKTGVLSEQQQKIPEYKDYLKYSRNVDERNIEPMTQEVRTEMANYYSSMVAPEEENVTKGIVR